MGLISVVGFSVAVIALVAGAGAMGWRVVKQARVTTARAALEMMNQSRVLDDLFKQARGRIGPLGDVCEKHLEHDLSEHRRRLETDTRKLAAKEEDEHEFSTEDAHQLALMRLVASGDRLRLLLYWMGQWSQDLNNRLNADNAEDDDENASPTARETHSVPDVVHAPQSAHVDPAPTSTRYVAPTSQSLKSNAEELAELYNEANGNRSVRERFRERFQPNRMGATNAVERRQAPDTPAVFESVPDGELFVIPVPGLSPAMCWVVPRFGLTIEAVNFKAGAIGEIFRTDGYDSQRHYSQFRVIAPAIFRQEGSRWRLQRQGEMDLGPGA